MAEYDEENNRLTLKIVYYGPALSGKTTNLISLHDFFSKESRGQMMTLDTGSDRTLFFDLLPIGVRTASGLLVKFKVFTVPGQVAHDGTRKALLNRSDGIVFVADSQIDQSSNNAESFHNLETNTSKVGIDLHKLPCIIQYNKRDLDKIINENDLSKVWKATPFNLVFAEALNHIGVLETFISLLRKIYRNLQNESEIDLFEECSENEFISLVYSSLGDVPQKNNIAECI